MSETNPKKETVTVTLLDEKRRPVGLYKMPKFQREPAAIVFRTQVFIRDSYLVYVQQFAYTMPFNAEKVR